MTFCLNCSHIRRSMFDVDRCFVSRLSFIDPNDESECYPCAAVNTDGACPKFEDRRALTERTCRNCGEAGHDRRNCPKIQMKLYEVEE